MTFWDAWILLVLITWGIDLDSDSFKKSISELDFLRTIFVIIVSFGITYVTWWVALPRLIKRDFIKANRTTPNDKGED